MKKPVILNAFRLTSQIAFIARLATSETLTKLSTGFAPRGAEGRGIIPCKQPFEDRLAALGSSALDTPRHPAWR